MTKSPQHSAPARALLDALDAEMAENGRRRGITLSWSAADVELRDQLADLKDKEVRLQEMWHAATDPKIAVKLSNELRQCKTAIQRILGTLKLDVPRPKSHTSVRASNAANRRWDIERERNAAIGETRNAQPAPTTFTLQPVEE